MRHIVVEGVGVGGKIEARDCEVVLDVVDEGEGVKARNVVGHIVDLAGSEEGVLSTIGGSTYSCLGEDPAPIIQRGDIGSDDIERYLINHRIRVDGDI